MKQSGEAHEDGCGAFLHSPETEAVSSLMRKNFFKQGVACSFIQR